VYALVNTATLNLVDTVLDVASQTGGGTVDLRLGGTLEVASLSGNTIQFADVGAVLDLLSAPGFTGSINGFAPGDTIDLANVIGNTATYDPVGHTLTLTTSGSNTIDATISHVSAAIGSLSAVSDGSGGTDIVYSSGGSALSYEIAAGDRAMGSNIVRATMDVPGTTTKITGAGVTIGIISSSFDDHLPGTADPANAAAAGGYIPAEPNGTSAVTVLSDYDSGTAGENEGLAMAELIHQVAPGATLDFATGFGADDTTFASAVTALKNAGANIIVDDLGFYTEPVYQLGGPIDNAVSAAIASGVDYFTSAGNSHNDYLNSTFTPTAATLDDGSTVTANLFDNGTVYEPIDALYGASYLDLYWSAPFYTSGDAALSMKLFDSYGNLLSNSVQYDNVNAGGTTVPVAEDYIYVPNTGTYYLAITQTGSASVGQFELKSEDQYGPLIADSAAGTGPGELTAQELIPAVNTVGAAPYASSAVYGATGLFPEAFSDAGPGSLLYDSNGNLLATPQSAGKVDFVAPDGIDTSVSGFAPFYGTSAAAPDAAAVAALVLQANPRLTPAQVTQVLEQTATPLTDSSAAEAGAGLVQAVAAVTLAEQISCFVTGTRILTDRGEVPVEALREGDHLVCASGERLAVCWLGHRRIDTSRHPRPTDIMPVRIAADAFGPGQPHRPVYLSPDHAVAVDGVLIPIHHLINDATVTQVQRDEVTYWHVELTRHEVLLAEGLACESYLDTGNRRAFANGPVVALHPGFAPTAVSAWAEAACAPLVESGPHLAAMRAALADRAARLGCPVCGSLDVTLNGPGCARVMVPHEVHTLRLVSAAARLAGDRRLLGALVTGLRIDGAAVPLNDARLVRGFHDVERHDGQPVRWTDGAAVLGLGTESGARLVEIEVAGISAAATEQCAA
jgi:hypothetical protein